MGFESILIRLLIAHFIGDFLLQPKKWVKQKEKHQLKSKYLYVHVLAHGLLAYVLIGDWASILMPLLVLIVHFLIDVLKLYQKNSTNWFLIDQLLHILSVIVIAFIFTTDSFEFSFYNFSIKSLVIILAYIVIMHPTSIFIYKLTKSWQKEIGEKYQEGLMNAGRWIGILERVLILTFILANQFTAIGFLLAAKSIFRFGDLTQSNNRKLTEYVLIGTLLSFTITILIGLFVTTL